MLSRLPKTNIAGVLQACGHLNQSRIQHEKYSHRELSHSYYAFATSFARLLLLLRPQDRHDIFPGPVQSPSWCARPHAQPYPAEQVKRCIPSSISRADRVVERSEDTGCLEQQLHRRCHRVICPNEGLSTSVTARSLEIWATSLNCQKPTNKSGLILFKISVERTYTHSNHKVAWSLLQFEEFGHSN